MILCLFYTILRSLVELQLKGDLVNIPNVVQWMGTSFITDRVSGDLDSNLNSAMETWGRGRQSTVKPLVT